MQRKQSAKHLRVFGSLCYKHVLDANRKKLGDISEPMILVGYHEKIAYMLYNPMNHSIIVSKDVLKYLMKNEFKKKLRFSKSLP